MPRHVERRSSEQPQRPSVPQVPLDLLRNKEGEEAMKEWENACSDATRVLEKIDVGVHLIH